MCASARSASPRSDATYSASAGPKSARSRRASSSRPATGARPGPPRGGPCRTGSRRSGAASRTRAARLERSAPPRARRGARADPDRRAPARARRGRPGTDGSRSDAAVARRIGRHARRPSTNAARAAWAPGELLARRVHDLAVARLPADPVAPPLQRGVGGPARGLVAVALRAGVRRAEGDREVRPRDAEAVVAPRVDDHVVARRHVAARRSALPPSRPGGSGAPACRTSRRGGTPRRPGPRRP